MLKIPQIIILLFIVSCSTTKLDMSFQDSDLDGVHDNKDACPEQPGSVFNLGCPDESKFAGNLNAKLSTDDDLDGVSNEKDECPQVHGSPFNLGCPFVTEANK